MILFQLVPASRKLADIDRERVVSSLLGSLSKAKRDRDQNVVQILRDRQSLHKILERKAALPCEEKNWLSKAFTKLRQTWRSKNWERRDSDIALYEINQEFASQRFQLQQANHWANQAQRRKISLHGELEMRKRLF